MPTTLSRSRPFAAARLLAAALGLAVILAPCVSRAADPPPLSAVLEIVGPAQDRVAEDPENLGFQYDLALAYLRAKRIDEAEGILRALLRADEQAYGKAWFDLASIHASRNQMKEALAALKKARALDPGRADYETGLVLMKLRKFRAACEAFRSAAANKPEIAFEARAQEAIAQYGLRNYARAEKILSTLINAAPDPARRQQVEEILRLVREGQKTDKPWNIFATVGVQYDSNVFQNPLQSAGIVQPTGPSQHKEDAEFPLTVTGRYRLFRENEWSGGAAYTHYQMLYAQNTSNNTFGALPGAWLEYQADPFILGLDYVYSHYWVDGDTYLSQHGILPHVVWLEADNLRAEGFFGVEFRDYENPTPDSRHYFASLLQYLMIRDNRGHVRLGVRTDYEDVIPAERGDYRTYEMQLGLLWPLYETRLFVDLAGKYTWRDFGFDPNIAANTNRNDTAPSFAAQLIGVVDEHTRVSLGYEGTWNNSNVADAGGVDPYHFRRHVVSCLLQFAW